MTYATIAVLFGLIVFLLVVVGKTRHDLFVLHKLFRESRVELNYVLERLDINERAIGSVDNKIKLLDMDVHGQPNRANWPQVASEPCNAGIAERGSGRCKVCNWPLNAHQGTQAIYFTGDSPVEPEEVKSPPRRRPVRRKKV